MSKRISISCPDHLYKLLSGLSDLQSRPMSKVVLEVLEASYPALNSVYHALIRLDAEKRLASGSLSSGVDSIITEFSSAINALISDHDEQLSGVTPPHSNTGATSSPNASKPTAYLGFSLL